MTKAEIAEYYEELYNLAVTNAQPLRNRYRKLRSSFERVVKELIGDSGLQATDLAARINYLAVQFAFNAHEQFQLHTFRLASNDVMNHRMEPNDAALLRDIRAVAWAFHRFFQMPIPDRLQEVLPKELKYTALKKNRRFIHRVRVCFDHADDQFLYVHPNDYADETFIRVRWNVEQVNEEFNQTIPLLWQHAQLNLLDVTVESEDIYVPSFIVLEPDYLIDISSLAECYKDYGHHPANYLLNRLVPIENARPLLLGNIANLFLDEWIYAGETVPDYTSCMKKAFRQYPIELATCEELHTQASDFNKDCKMHFEHIRQMVTDTFKQEGYGLDKSDAVLEPSYICEALGVQGRLDYMQRDMSSFIEMKSGKADEYAMQGKIQPKENNRVQMLLYMAVLEYSMGQDRKKMRPFLLYTRYPLLYPAQPSWAHVRRIINLRNLIVGTEYGVQLHNNSEYTRKVLAQITPENLNQKQLTGGFWSRYLAPSIADFESQLEALTPIEQSYFYTVYNFITKELYTSKSGDVENDGRSGAAALWLSTLDEKRESGEILYDLQMTDNKASQQNKPYLTFAIPAYEDEFLPNFREGDVVVVYERNQAADNVTNKLVFKGNIEYITDDVIKIRLRAAQRNLSVFTPDSMYAIEHDTMDTSYRTMFLGLSAFLRANAERRALLLGQRPPRFTSGYEEKIATADDDFERVALKAEAARDYFLLVGPPGTGKTSCALRRMVERFHAKPNFQLLLMAYTNRAVDEICQSLSRIEPAIDYIRVGSELSCDTRFRSHLIENVLEECTTRKEVIARMDACRIYVGTIATLSSKRELFKLKHFDATIIDEATQILEPQLLGLLSSCSKDGKNAIDKFILIGDHKQLPAVVLQRAEQSEVYDNNLRDIGLYNLKDSLFERLYRTHLKEKDSPAIDMLCRQGRMHPAVAVFPNQSFYGGRLAPVGLAHQLEQIDHPVNFIASQRDTASQTGKTNQYEAQIVAQLVEQIYDRYADQFDAHHTVGIITPYRSQIAMIRKALFALGIPALNNITVDTVERYQGSERDVILYSFCVNYLYQLKFLPNLIEENGVLIDRKLNVALTRARKELYIIGVPELLQHNPIYSQLLNYLTGLNRPAS